MNKMVRTRDHLSSFQVTKEQKQTIDIAYDVYISANERFVSKGEFIEKLAIQFIQSSKKQDVR